MTELTANFLPDDISALKQLIIEREAAAQQSLQEKVSQIQAIEFQLQKTESDLRENKDALQENQIQLREKQIRLQENQIQLQETHTQLEETHTQLQAKASQLQEQDERLQKKQREIELLKEALQYLKLKKFGKSSERHVGEGQADFFNEAEHEEAPEGEEWTAGAAPAEISEQLVDENSPEDPIQKKRPGRRPLPEYLPRRKIIHKIDENEKYCSCGCAREAYDEETSEQLTIIPAKLIVLRHCRIKYRCPNCKEKPPITSPLPAQPIPKSNASADLLAHIIVSKFLDGLPFYRQEKMWARLDIELPRATQANWSIACGKLVQPLVNLMIEIKNISNLVYIDETTVQVLKERNKPPDGKKYFWLSVGGPEKQQVFHYHYDPSRGSEVISEILRDFKGVVMSDDWSAYASYCQKHGLTHIACNDHARRKFDEAFKSLPKAKKSGVITKAEMALLFYKKLYRIEREIKGKTADEKMHLRKQKSLPVWSKFIAWLEKNIQLVTPESLLGKAIHYAYKLKDKLSYYCQDGNLPISNQVAENAIRPFVIARKNFLFFDTPAGANASANLYSLIITAKHHGLNPQQYLAYVLAKLPICKNLEDVEKLLPWAVSSDWQRSPQGG